MRVNREIDARVPHVEHVPRHSVPDVVRIRDDWRLGYTPRWPHVCIRKQHGVKPK
jgi:hypothetical protein